MRSRDHAKLLEDAIAYTMARYEPNRHHVICVLATGRKLYRASHLDTSGGLDVCAEPIALSNAISEGDEDSVSLISVAWDGNDDTEPWVITPCGNCRQILSEYAPNLRVIIDGDTLETATIAELLPYPYSK